MNRHTTNIVSKKYLFIFSIYLVYLHGLVVFSSGSILFEIWKWYSYIMNDYCLLPFLNFWCMFVKWDTSSLIRSYTYKTCTTKFSFFLFLLVGEEIPIWQVSQYDVTIKKEKHIFYVKHIYVKTCFVINNFFSLRGFVSSYALNTKLTKNKL